MNDCYEFPEPLNYLCGIHVELDKKNESIATQFHITVGITSGVGFVLLALIVGLFVKLHKLQTGYDSTPIFQDHPQFAKHIDRNVSLNDLSANKLPSPQTSVSEYDPEDYENNIPLASGPKKVKFFSRIHLGSERKSSEIGR